MKWIMKELAADREIQELSRALATQEAFPLPLAQVLFQRGIKTYDQARDFFRPPVDHLHSPWEMKDMDKAVSRILAALRAGEKMLIYGDYDVDGTTSVTLLKLFFRAWGWEVDYYIPDRYTEGYGVSFKGVEWASQQGYNLIIALDCGTKSPDKVELARQRGMDFIICDHHQTGGTHPGSHAFLNPLQEGCNYPFKDLSACGIGLKLIQALHEKLESEKDYQHRNQGVKPLDAFADLVALSIGADLVPMVGENRIIAWHGIEKLRSSPLPGIASLMRLSTQTRTWDIGDVVFFIAPLINSAGRLNHAKGAVDVLMGDHLEQDFVARLLEQSNADRRELDKEMTQHAVQLLQDQPGYEQLSTTVLHDASWHKGVIGIVASRVIERHYRPTILLTRSEDGLWVGSGRSIHGFDLHEALESCSSHLVQFGGHKFAAGLTVKEENLAAFKAAFEAYGTQHIGPDQKEPRLEIACPVDFSYLTPKFVRILKALSPFGPANPEPVFLAQDVEVAGMRVLQDEHLRLTVRQGEVTLVAIGFGLARRWNEVNSDRLDLAFQPDFNTWNGVTTLQLKLKDIRKAI